MSHFCDQFTPPSLLLFGYPRLDYVPEASPGQARRPARLEQDGILQVVLDWIGELDASHRLW